MSMPEDQKGVGDSTHAMQSLMTYADDDDPTAEDSLTEHHPGASFISDDEDEHRHAAVKSADAQLDSSKVDNIDSRVSPAEENTKDISFDSPATKHFKAQITEPGCVWFVCF